MYYVYILQSEKDQSFYKGFTEDPMQRIIEHNTGESLYTSSKIPWKYVYIECFEDKKSALIRERAIKKYGHERIERLIASPKNQLTRLKL